MRTPELIRRLIMLLLMPTTSALTSGLRAVAPEDAGLSSQRLTRLNHTFRTHVEESLIAGALVVDGRMFKNLFAVSALFVLRDGQWKLVHGHCSPPIRGRKLWKRSRV